MRKARGKTEKKGVDSTMGRPNFCHSITREAQTNIITMIHTLNTIIVSRGPILFGVAMKTIAKLQSNFKFCGDKVKSRLSEVTLCVFACENVLTRCLFIETSTLTRFNHSESNQHSLLCRARGHNTVSLLATSILQSDRVRR